MNRQIVMPNIEEIIGLNDGTVPEVGALALRVANTAIHAVLIVVIRSGVGCGLDQAGCVANMPE